MYFPRLILPAAGVLATVVDFVMSWLFFNLIAAFFGFWTWLFIPFTVVLLLLQTGAAMGFGLVFAAFSAKYRDVAYVIPWLLQMGMWLTPVVWPLDRLLETRWGGDLMIFIYLNPMAGVIESYRALLAGNYVPWVLLASNFGVTLALLAAGILLFRRREDSVVDLL